MVTTTVGQSVSSPLGWALCCRWWFFLSVDVGVIFSQSGDRRVGGVFKGMFSSGLYCSVRRGVVSWGEQ